MVSVGDIGRRNVGKCLDQRVDLLGIGYTPYTMRNAVLGNKVAQGGFGTDIIHQGVNCRTITVGKEDGPGLSIERIDMANAVALLLLKRIFVLLDGSVLVFVDRATRHNANLAAPVHDKLVEEKTRSILTHERAVGNALAQQIATLFVHLVGIHIHLGIELGFRAVDV